MIHDHERMLQVREKQEVIDELRESLAMAIMERDAHVAEVERQSHAQVILDRQIGEARAKVTALRNELDEIQKRFVKAYNRGFCAACRQAIPKTILRIDAAGREEGKT